MLLPKQQESFVLLLSKSIGHFIQRFILRHEVDLFFENLSAMLDSGLDIHTGLNAIMDDTNSKRMKRVILEIDNDIRKGSTLAESLESTHSFSDYAISLIRMGEESGRLIENIGVLVLHQQKDAIFKSRVNSALLYSVIVLSLTVVVGIGASLFILPRLANLYLQIGVDLPFLTRLIIGLGSFVSRFGFIVIPFIGLMIGSAFYFLFSFPRTKFIGHSLLFHLPLIRDLIKQVEVARFCYLLGTMLSSGVPLLQAMESLKDISTFRNYQQFYTLLYQNIRKGGSFHKSFEEFDPKRRLFTASARQTMFAAERTGTLPQTLLKIARSHEEKSEETARNLPVLIEPILLVIVGIAIALLAMATILPIYSLINVI